MILGLDPARKAGYSVLYLDGRKAESGMIDFKGDRPEMLFNFRKKILDLYANYGEFKMIGYEKPIAIHYNATRSHSNFEGVILSVSHEINSSVLSLSPDEIKKFATGKGKASKKAMLKVARNIWGESVIDDNEADALFISSMTLNNYIKVNK